MINLKKLLNIFIICFLAMSCSSTPEKKYDKTEIDMRATQYLYLADNYKQKGMNKEAHYYYKEAQILFFLKGDLKNHCLAKLKEAIIYLLEQDSISAQKIIEDVQTINHQGELSLTNSINSVKARILYFEQKTEEANTLVIDLLNQNQENREKYAYYLFLWATNNLEQVNSTKYNDLKKVHKEIITKYESKNLESIEILSFISTSMATLELHRKNFNEALQILTFTENLLKKQEFLAAFIKIYDLYIQLYMAQNNLQKANYYKTLKEKHAIMQKAYR